MNLLSTIATSWLLLVPFSEGATSPLSLRNNNKKGKETKTSLEISIHGLLREPSSREIAVMKDALITAYNQVHAQNDSILLDFITTAFETSPNDEEYIDDSLLLESSPLVVGASGKYDMGIWLIGIANSACRFCPSDDLLSLGGGGPFAANVKAVEKLFCRLLDESGENCLEHTHDYLPRLSLARKDVRRKRIQLVRTLQSPSTAFSETLPTNGLLPQKRFYVYGFQKMTITPC
jgi:hypothetical protein